MRARNLLLPAAFVAIFSTAASADVWNKKTRITFSGPVEVPGAKLEAGTYVFKLVESQSNRHIVQVQNEAENKTHAVILAIPDYRLNPTSKTVMYFSERSGDQPAAVKSWFYPGDNFGQRFVYPKERAQQLARTVSQPVPSYTSKSNEPITLESGRTVDQFNTEQPGNQTSTYKAEDFEKFDSADKAGEEGEVIKQPETTTSQSQTTPPATTTQQSEATASTTTPQPSEAASQQAGNPPTVTPTPQTTREEGQRTDSRMAAQVPASGAAERDSMPATSSPIHMMAAAGAVLLGLSMLARSKSH